MANYFLTEDDKSILQEIIREKRIRRLNSGAGHGTHAEFNVMAPEVYVVKIPEGGIPPRVGVEPGSAICDIYAVVQTGTLDFELTIAGGSTKVYNLSGVAILESAAYVKATRDKFGSWIVDTDTGSFVGIIQARDTLEVSPEVGDLSHADAYGYHFGQIMVWDDATDTLIDGGDCWFRLVDFEDPDLGEVITEWGRNYGGMSFVGTLTNDFDETPTTLPYFLGTVNEQTFLAKPDTVISLGGSGVFHLYHRDPEVDSGCEVTAKCLVAEVTDIDTFWTVSRIRGGKWYATPYYCEEPEA